MRKITKIRIVVLAIAIVAIILSFFTPVLSFYSDTGIYSERTYQMDLHYFRVIHTGHATGNSGVVRSMSVAGLRYCLWGLLVLTSLAQLTLLLRFSRSTFLYLALMDIIVGGAYYTLAVIYIVRINALYYPSFYPNIGLFLPGIAVALMLLVRRSIQIEIHDQQDGVHHSHRHQ
ncbi:MAG: hypothetical protein IKQ48_00080 [Paludibacteraceae bacterium]|nr:hypothetical protein [Paludibacteraceae bacterium]